MLADLVPREAYGRAYGFERAMDNLGAIIGPLLAIALVASVGVRSAIALSVIPGLLAVVAIAYAARRIRASRSTERRPIRLQIRPVLQGELRRTMVAIAAFELGNVAATLLILRSTDLLTQTHTQGEAVQISLWLYAGYNVAATAASLIAGHAGDRFGARLMFVVGVATFLLAYIAFGAASASVPVLAGAFALAGCGIGIVETSEHATVAARAPDSIRGIRVRRPRRDPERGERGGELGRRPSVDPDVALVGLRLGRVLDDRFACRLYQVPTL